MNANSKTQQSNVKQFPQSRGNEILMESVNLPDRLRREQQQRQAQAGHPTASRAVNSNEKSPEDQLLESANLAETLRNQQKAKRGPGGSGGGPGGPGAGRGNPTGSRKVFVAGVFWSVVALSVYLVIELFFPVGS